MGRFGLVGFEGLEEARMSNPLDSTNTVVRQYTFPIEFESNPTMQINASGEILHISADPQDHQRAFLWVREDPLVDGLKTVEIGLWTQNSPIPPAGEGAAWQFRGHHVAGTIAFFAFEKVGGEA